MVKVVEESSPYFKVISPKDIGHKVAPGVPSIFRVVFTPEENKVIAALARNWLNACHWQFAILNIHGGGGVGGGIVGIGFGSVVVRGIGFVVLVVSLMVLVLVVVVLVLVMVLLVLLMVLLLLVLVAVVRR